MFISHSFVRQAAVTLGAAVGFVFVYETTIRDSRYAARQATAAEASARPAAVGTPLSFTATAYCKGETTASGVVVRTGIAAADPALLPVGSVVRLAMTDSRYDGVWTIMDTGPAVQGRTLDLYMWSCKDALKFGRQPVRVDVLRLGWNPQNSERAVVDTLFRKREIDKASLPLTAKPVDPAAVIAATTPPES